jgi:hypothetical protein
MQTVESYLQQPRLAKFPFVFIVTYGRSGSTLLLGLLNALPGYHICGENDGALVPVFRAYERLRRARYQWGTKENLPENPWYGAHLIMPELFARGCVDAFFGAVLRPPLGTRACGFKEIRYTDLELNDDEFTPFLHFMLSGFPGAAFVFNVRNIEKTASSGWWKDQNPEIVQRRLAGAVQRMTDYAQAHPENTLVFEYDRITSDATYFKTLCDFLGEPFDESVVHSVLSSPHSVIRGISRARNSR